MIRLTTIGPPAIQIGATRVSPASLQAFSALLYLTVERGKPVSRRTLLEMFFPDASDNGASHSLRQLVYRLRKLGARLKADATSVTLPGDAATWDVEDLLERGVAREQDLEALAKGYLGVFFPEHSERYTRWLEEHRAQVTGKLRHLLLRQITAERSRRQFRVLENTARACLALDPLNEEATLALAESLAVAGAKADALQLLDQYIEEVGHRPADIRISPRILRERISEYFVDSDHAPVAMIGRDAELGTIVALLDQAAVGASRGAIVTGTSGIGKSRLVNEACALAALNGQAVVRARLHQQDTNRPFAILRDLGPGLLDLPGSLGASPEALASLRGLCGRGPSQYRRIPSESLEAQAVGAAVRSRVLEVVDAITDEQPLVLFLEDAQWIDAASLQLVAEILDDQRPVTVLIASTRKLTLPDTLRVSPTVTEIALTPLNAAESGLVLHRLFARIGREPTDRFIESAISAAGGNPFYLYLLFDNYRTTGDPEGLPQTLSASLTARLDQLTEPARSVFDAVVVLGPYCSETRLERITQHPRYALLHALRWLEEGGFVKPAGTLIVPSHDLLSAAATKRLPSSLARLLHRSTAECLEAEGQPAIEPLVVAAHWEACGEDSRALQVLSNSARDYSRLGRPREAVDLLTRARPLAHSYEAQRKVDEALFQMYHAAGEDRLELEVADRLGFLAGEGSPDQQVMAISAAVGAGREVVPFQSTLHAIAGSRDVDTGVRASAARNLLIIAEDLGDEVVGRQAIQLTADLERRVDTIAAELIYETVFGAPDEAIGLALRLRSLARYAESTRDRLMALSTAGIALWRSGDTPNAVSCCEAAYDLGAPSACGALAQPMRQFSLKFTGAHATLIRRSIGLIWPTRICADQEAQTGAFKFFRSACS